MDDFKERCFGCQDCELSKTRNNVVFGEGDPHANVMLIGEAPGKNEDLQGRPFVGAAGKILDELLESAGLDRESVFITSILKCRPPGNRNPTRSEIIACTPCLNKQIEIIKPKVIGCMGNFAARFIMEKFGLGRGSISSIHGSVYNVSTLYGVIRIIPLFHPAAALYDRKKIDLLKEDFKMLNGG